MGDSGYNWGVLDYTQPDRAPLSSFAESAYNPFFDLCAQVAESADFAPFIDRTGPQISERRATDDRLLRTGQFATVVRPPTDAAEFPTWHAQNLASNARILESGRIR